VELGSRAGGERLAAPGVRGGAEPRPALAARPGRDRLVLVARVQGRERATPDRGALCARLVHRNLHAIIEELQRHGRGVSAPRDHHGRVDGDPAAGGLEGRERRCPGRAEAGANPDPADRPGTAAGATHPGDPGVCVQAEAAHDHTVSLERRAGGVGLHIDRLGIEGRREAELDRVAGVDVRRPIGRRGRDQRGRRRDPAALRGVLGELADGRVSDVGNRVQLVEALEAPVVGRPGLAITTGAEAEQPLGRPAPEVRLADQGALVELVGHAEGAELLGRVIADEDPVRLPIPAGGVDSLLLELGRSARRQEQQDPCTHGAYISRHRALVGPIRHTKGAENGEAPGFPSRGFLTSRAVQDSRVSGQRSGIESN
jgi:hypothetical protein